MCCLSLEKSVWQWRHALDHRVRAQHAQRSMRMKADLVAVLNHKLLKWEGHRPVNDVIFIGSATLVGRETIATVSDKSPIVGHRADEGQCVEAGHAIATQREPQHDSLRLLSGRRQDTPNPTVSPLPGLMQACGRIETLPKISHRTAQ